MKYLQTFSVFESQTSGTLTPKQEAFLDRYTKGTWSVNPTTGLVDVQGTFYCSHRKLKSLYEIQFGTVTGNFYCDYNQLTTLEGAPLTVGVTFSCWGNELTTLEGAPLTVGGTFDCSVNQLTTLTGAPRTVEGGFDCSTNKLTTLIGAPQTVKGRFWCYNNQLTTLVGAPQTVKGSFRCNAFELKPGQWNLAGWEQVLHTGSSEARKLISTLPYLQPDWWNSEISSNPIGTLLRLAAVWDRLPEDIKGGIKIPSNLQNDFDNFLDLERAGIF